MLNLIRLEERIVFDGADAADQHTDGDAPARVVGAEQSAGDRILAIDMSMENADRLAAATKDGVTVVAYDSRVNTLQEIRDMIAAVSSDGRYSSIAFAGHGTSGQTALAVDAMLTLAELTANPELADFFNYLSGLLAEGGRIALLGCNVAEGELGAELINTLEELTGIDFAASDDATGNEGAGGDWLLETDGVDAAEAYFDADLLTEFLEVLDSNNYIFDNGLLSYVNYPPREVEQDSAWWDRDYIGFVGEPPPGMACMEMRFTLTKNGLDLDLEDFLAFSDKLSRDPDTGAFIYTSGARIITLPGLYFDNGAFVMKLAHSEENSLGYYSIEGTSNQGTPSSVPIHLVLGDKYNSILPMITFGDIPNGAESDSFSLKLEAYALASNGTKLGNGNPYAEETGIKFKWPNQTPEPGPEPEPEPENPEPSTPDPEPEEPPHIPTPPPTPAPGDNGEQTPPSETGNSEQNQTETPSTESPSSEPPSTEGEAPSGEGDGTTDSESGEEAGEDVGEESTGESGDETAAEEAPKDEASGEETAGEDKTPGNTAEGEGDASDSDVHDMDAIRHRLEEEEEIVKSYPEDMRAEVQEVVSIAGQAAGEEKTVFATINVSMAELGETLTQFSSAFGHMLGMLSHLADLGGDAELMTWVQDIGSAREELLAASNARVSMLLGAVHGYKALSVERRDSVAVDSVAELNAAIDDVNRQLRAVMAGMTRMTREINELRDRGDAAATAARLPKIKEHMRSVAESMKAMHEKRDSMFFDLRHAATLAGKTTR